MDGKKLKSLREQRGYSLTRLSEIAGISKSYLSLIERQIQTNPGLETLEKLAKALDVEVKYFFKKETETEESYKEKASIKSTLKLEIELSEEQITPEKIQHIKELLDVINNE